MQCVDDPVRSYEERSMKLSTERILTTHVGSLPRPRLLLDLILAKESRGPAGVGRGRYCQRRGNEQALLRDLCEASRRWDWHGRRGRRAGPPGDAKPRSA